ncbi:23S rRNA (adenine(2503)-C(2))-methyltransferase RlmN [Nitrospira defluvii]|nr:23S rRNA (adenine(2503)-C(2))-methyltransferase RlmN [Nitrospira defluvii]
MPRRRSLSFSLTRHPMTIQKTNLIALNFDALRFFILGLGWKRYRADQVLSWIYKRYVSDMNAMTDLSIADRRYLSEKACLSHLNILTRLKSIDGTEKFLFELEDGKQIETVLIREENRRTLCISSQAGCTLDCTFCLTAQEGLKRNLKTEEILNQFLTVQALLPKGDAITNVVLMGMGEPLANLKAVTEACERMISPEGLHLAPRRITISTAGLVPQMETFWSGPVSVNLSISLNATTDALRDQIMPKINRLYPIAELMAACRRARLPTRRSITFEYVMLSGVNDSLEDAERLLRLTKGIRCKVNLIPFNAFPGAPFQSSSEDQILHFQNRLLQAKLRTTVRKSKGRDILAACGQLNSQFTN